MDSDSFSAIKFVVIVVFFFLPESRGDGRILEY